MNKKTGFCIGVFFAAVCGPGQADVRVPAIIGEHMVLQAGASTPVWGWADPGEAVAVRVGDSTVATTAGKDGRWKVAFTDLKASATPVTVTVVGRNTLTFVDVLIGDVWICSGQSNMALPLRRVVGRDVNDPKGLGQANHPQIRLFKMAKETFLEPQVDCEGSWAVCTPEAAREFSAAGYFFGREIHQAEKIPVGLVNACRGSSTGQMWTSLEGLKSDPALSNYLAEALAAKAVYPRRKERYLQERAKWKEDTARWPETIKGWEAAAAKARAEGREVAAKPAGPGAAPARPTGMDPWEDNVLTVPTVLYNSMIAPIIPFGIKGVIWYQGEGNAHQWDLYRALFPAMVRDWRGRWGRGDFPVYFVQLSRNLSNTTGLPASPFRTDDWPLKFTEQ
ncbi:MAG: hypothetical protein O3A87_02995 [Verrucomicrobia bacterium]|nr:hypothetical protein [Verrucomicrobiota bacterium]MDA1005433.1 hypothetical protein [Verrucomicrobiota bacterium]